MLRPVPLASLAALALLAPPSLDLRAPAIDPAATAAARQGRNPRTGKTLTIAASKTVGFKAAPKFKAASEIDPVRDARAGFVQGACRGRGGPKSKTQIRGTGDMLGPSA